MSWPADYAAGAWQDRSLRLLRARWRTASLAAGWRFPSDWALPEVDAVCAAVTEQGAPETAMAGLARARATAGAGLTETLTDAAALHAVLQRPDSQDGFVAPDVDATPARLVRVVSVAWADVAAGQLAHAQVLDPLTGLVTDSYLRTRLGEVYRQAAQDGKAAGDAHVMLVVSMDFSSAPGWTRFAGMIVAADALRCAFDGGQTLAAVGPSTIAALAAREADLGTRAVTLRRELTERMAVDRQLARIGAPSFRVVRLPATYEGACDLLTTLSRA